ncbi:MAG: hypothetical protein RLP14_08195 [Owenweeksia sp.]
MKVFKMGLMALLLSFVFIGCKKKTDPPPPALDVVVNVPDHSYLCYSSISPIDIAYNGWGALEIQIDEQNGGGNPFARSYFFYGMNPALNTSGNCVSLEIPKNSPSTFTAYLFEKRRNPECLAPPSGQCVKWMKTQTIPATNYATTDCASAITIKIVDIDPGFFVPCNL